MNHKTPVALLFALVLSLLPAQGFSQKIFDAGIPSNLFTVGLRAGVNTSNLNIDKDVFPSWNINSWGTGFELGATVGLNLRNFISIQPGFFFESRSGNYAYASQNLPAASETQMGHYRNAHFTIPILAQYRIKLLPGCTWSIDVGPYFSWLLHSRHHEQILYADPASLVRSAQRNRYDWGLKVGTGLDFLTHFYAGIHYKAGMRDVWNSQLLGGRSKVWTFSVGYNF